MAQQRSSAQAEESALAEQASIRSRRSLKKCSQCRKNRKKCLPVDREWPQKCERCLKSGFQCSPPLLKREDGPESYDSDVRGDDAYGEDVSSEGLIKQGILVSSGVHGAVPKSSGAAQPRKRLKRKLDDVETPSSSSPKIKRSRAKKRRMEKQGYDDTKSGASIPQMLSNIGFLYLADKELKRKKNEHFCYIKECDICDYLISVRENIKNELATQTEYAESIADSIVKQCTSHPNDERYMLDEADTIYNYLRNMTSSNGITLDDPYNKARIRKHIGILRLQRNWPQAEFLLEKLVKHRDSPSARTDSEVFLEYLQCLEETSKEVSTLIANFKPPGETSLMDLEFPLPAVHRAIANGVPPPENFVTDPDQRDMFGRKPLLVAAFHGKMDWCAMLIAQCEAPLDDMDLSGHTALEIASRMGHGRIVQHLVDSGAEVNPKLLGFSATPLHAAVRGGDLDIVKKLVDAGGKIDTVTGFDESSPLDLAREIGNWGIKNYLEKRAASHHEHPLLDLPEDDTLGLDRYSEGIFYFQSYFALYGAITETVGESN